ncbi:MAG: hypothetical protein R3D29_11590 [Nitratireductor sp.]
MDKIKMNMMHSPVRCSTSRLLFKPEISLSPRDEQPAVADRRFFHACYSIVQRHSTLRNRKIPDTKLLQFFRKALQ